MSVLASRLASQGLTEPLASSPEAVVERVLAVQAQDLRAACLAIRARSTGLTSRDVDRALTNRTLVVSWLNRATLHLVATEDFWWLHSLTAPRQVTMNERRLHQEGVSPTMAARGVELIADLLQSRGPQTRDQVRAHLEQANVRVVGQALIHIVLAASIEGHVVRGPIVGTDQAFAHAPSWVGPRPEIDPADALRQLAERYLRGHGPATDRDLVKWSGLSLGDARRALASISDRTEAGADGQLRLADAPPTNALPAPRLLGGFDPILHGWASREFLVPSDNGVVTSNGVFRPTALVNGQVVATWRYRSGDIELIALPDADRLSTDERRTLAREADDVRRFLANAPE